MLNETASSTEDRPGLRSSVRPVTGGDETHHIALREKVATVLFIERERFEPPTPEQASRDAILLLNPHSQFVATFEGRLLDESEAAYSQLDALLQPDDELALFREAEGRHIVHVVRGRVQVTPRNPWINVILFVATLFSVLLIGTSQAINEIASVNEPLAESVARNILPNLWRGLPYAISILLILGGHELGHYFAGRRHKIAVTLPYFIPAPFLFLGTMGAFIQLREPMRNRKVLLDVGAAGPLAGLIFAIPILFIGLNTSPVLPLPPISAMEGNSIFYAFAKILVFGEFLPNGRVDVYINQLATAGWAGLLVTALNLIPIGQLDGGHILFSFIGQQARRLYWPLIGAAAVLAFRNPDTWLLWLVLLLLFGRSYAAPLDMITPLDGKRRAIAILSLVLFVLMFVPVPLSYVQNGPALPAPRNSVFLLPMITALIVMTWQRLRRRF